MMRNRITGTVAATAVVASIGFGWYAYGQVEAINREHQGQGMEMVQGMQDREGMSDEMKARMRMNMHVQINPADPAALLAMKRELNLTDEQVQQLQALTKQMREAATEVLTDEQRRQVEALPQRPQTMMQMHRQMMERMGEHGMMGDRDQMMGCPMMRVMHMDNDNGGTGSATQPEE